MNRGRWIAAALVVIVLAVGGWKVEQARSGDATAARDAYLACRAQVVAAVLVPEAFARELGACATESRIVEAMSDSQREQVETCVTLLGAISEGATMPVAARRPMCLDAAILKR